MHTILVLGGYGFFGSRICHALSKEKNIHLLVGGRNADKAQSMAERLGLDASQGLSIDANAADLAQQLLALNVDTVIHTAGPFQGQDYGVARAAIAAESNYIDLADGRDFVAGIVNLDQSARQRGLVVTSGASSLPALSSAVVDHYLSRFSRLTSIRHGIGSGARAPGMATMRGVFGYCGKPFLRLDSGHWTSVRGWLDTRRHRFPSPVGTRFLGSCDVPDLILFPKRYPQVTTVSFHAGFASVSGHLLVAAASQLVRLGLLRSIVPLVGPLHKISQWLEPLVSDKGGMFVSMEGDDVNGLPQTLTWHLIAGSNHGPHIPCGASIALAIKLARGDKLHLGAQPCMGMLSVKDYLTALDGLDVHEVAA
ncbi:saccharopine dehydrogenase family protein [Herbaspirillum sp. RV1423]|uniref:saccharopine dehydrogenase family protein n=1 Tax=Herbaspirillum sp. RV1423 TaxID=1443993 RepID=UPI0004BB1C6D|nr:saccharopine dehydrogenase NADP-binding domain-containing protein [Herbaspirillum sp. RV1423]